ncbi:MAG: hypothetical protein GQ574_22945 [Crocinitomix sp.]|nr:hypothetical protein [Crocinitomix sp.]
MNKKSWTRILIVIVAGLWAYNIYRTVENYQVTTETQSEQQNTNMSFAPVMFNKDTFLLDLPLEDPFLRNGTRWSQSMTTSNVPPSANQSQRNPQRQNPAPPIDKKIEWPAIEYFGFIRNHTANHQLCMLKIANKNHRLSVGDSKGQVTLIQAYSDSVVLSFLNELKTVKK